jgi:hypothetical protein
MRKTHDNGAGQSFLWGALVVLALLLHLLLPVDEPTQVGGAFAAGWQRTSGDQPAKTLYVHTHETTRKKHGLS